MQEEAQEQEGQQNDVKLCDYVLNTSTKKFHIPDCSSVNSMKEQNKKKISSTRQAVIEDGYKPCSRCEP